MHQLLKKICCGNRNTHRFCDEKGNRVSASRLLRNCPRAISSKIAAACLGIHPAVPWISYDARKLLVRVLPKTASVLEFGSGRSTLWQARMFSSVWSVEHDSAWHLAVRALITAHAINNVHYFLHTDRVQFANFPETAAHKFDFIMIDGIERASCSKTALARIKHDAIIYLDNSDKHPNGGDTRLAEEILLKAAARLGGKLQYFTDFAPTDLFCNQGLLLALGQFATRI